MNEDRSTDHDREMPTPVVEPETTVMVAEYQVRAVVMIVAIVPAMVVTAMIPTVIPVRETTVISAAVTVVVYTPIRVTCAAITSVIVLPIPVVIRPTTEHVGVRFAIYVAVPLTGFDFQIAQPSPAAEGIT